MNRLPPGVRYVQSYGSKSPQGQIAYLTESLKFSSTARAEAHAVEETIRMGDVACSVSIGEFKAGLVALR